MVAREPAFKGRRTRIRSGAAYIGARSPVAGSLRHVFSTAGDLAGRMARRAGAPDGFVRGDVCSSAPGRCEGESVLEKYPQAAYMSGVESWRELPNGGIEFTMRRLRTAD